MSQTRDQLISYLQSLITKRVSQQKPCAVINLVGLVSQFKEFKDWLKNNYKNEFKYNLTRLIQEDSHHFQYDFQTGNVSVNNCMDSTAKPLLKPRLLSDLEDSLSMDKIDDNLAVLELIVFVINQTKNGAIVSELMQSIEQNCEKQFNCFKSMFGLKDIEMDPEVNLNVNELHLIHLTETLLNPIFSFDCWLMTISRISELSDILDTLSPTCILLVKNCLVTHFYRFGRKTSNELHDWFENKYQILTEFLTTGNTSLDRIIGLFPEDFELRVIDRTTKLVDLNPKLLGKSRYLEFELMYKYGSEIRGITGIVKSVDRKSAKLESNIVFSINYHEFKPEFKVISDSVRALGQEVYDLSVFIHSGDQITFDVKFQNFENFCDEKTKNSFEYLWLVSSIYDIKHTAICFVSPTFYDWTQFSYSANYSEHSSSDSDSDSQEGQVSNRESN